MLRQATALIGIVSMIYATGLSGAPVQRVTRSSSSTATQPQMYSIGNGKSVQVLTGVEALNHLKNLQARRPQVFAKSSERLRARGWKPTENVVVVRTVRDSLARRGGSNGIVPAQTAYTDEGEVVFWSWDDGDDGTWEGEMWAQRYSDAAEALSDAQADVRTEDQYVIWEDLVYWDSPTIRQEYQQVRENFRKASPFLLASLRPANGIQLARVDARQFVRDWMACTVVGCGGAAAGCVFSGPLYIECVFLGCHAAVSFCALGEIIRRL